MPSWGDKRPAITYWAIKNHHWREVVAWYGVLAENVVQALARELLVDAMFRFEQCGFPVVLTVHDEIVVEHVAIAKGTVEEIMKQPPRWAEDLELPIAVEAWVGKGVPEIEDAPRAICYKSGVHLCAAPSFL